MRRNYNESAPLDGLMGQRLFQYETQIITSIFQMAELGKKTVSQAMISEEEQGQRLDNYLLRHLKGVPKSRVYRIVRSGEVRINGARCQPDQRLNAGDELRLPPVRTSAFVEARPPVAPAIDLMPASNLPRDLMTISC